MGDRPQHCEWGPSALARLDKCPGSLRLSSNLAETESEDASRGTRIHALAARLILGGKPDDADDTAELELAQKISDYAKSEIEAAGALEVHAEQEVEYSLFPGEVLFWGTSDLILVCADCVRVYDWKTGFRPVTEAENNLQGAAYALAAMQGYRRDTAIVTFFNPSINQLTAAEFNDTTALALEISKVIRNAQKDDAPCNPGEEQCRYCRAAAAGVCAARLAVCMASANIADGRTIEPIEAWDDGKIDLWLEKLAIADRFREQLKAEAVRRCNENGQCGGWIVKEQSGGREARDICQAWVMLSDELEQSDFLECCSLSVSKLKALYSSKAVEAGKAKTKKEAGQAFEELLAGCLQDKPARVCLVRKEAAK
jgi:hypothetical protein